MSILFSIKSSALLQNSLKCFPLKSLHRKHQLANLMRQLSTQKSQEEEKIHERTFSFQETVKLRKQEADRSIIVQVQSAQSCTDLHAYCNTIGKVKNMFHYTTGAEPMHFIIVEFSDETDTRNTFLNASYMHESQVVPVQSSFLWFRMPTKKLPKLKTPKNFCLNIENGSAVTKDFNINEVLMKSENISEQMVVLHEMTKLNEVGTRLRFLVAKQIEMSLGGMFPSTQAIPFGSSVNGCGKMGCDLDLVLVLKGNNQNITEDTRLVFHSKASSGSERSVSQRHMEVMGDLIQLFLPGCAQVRRILQARVPIIKFYQQLADVECDLSMSNVSGVHMSDFLHLMGSIDDRVRPLIFTVRKWAAESGLTNSSPGRWITNFSLTLLVLGFLQNNNLSEPILPSLNKLVAMAGSNDKFVTDEGVNCTFLRSASKYLKKYPTKNTDSLESLLNQFFEYYYNFNFQEKAICLNEGLPITKPEHSALYIVNPLERGLNVSKNVSLEELEKFKTELKNAMWTMTSDELKSSNWGLQSLFLNKNRTSVKANFYLNTGKSRLIQVGKLFDDDNEITFKNDAVKKNVDAIKKHTKEQLKKIETTNLDLSRQKSGR